MKAYTIDIWLVLSFTFFSPFLERICQLTDIFGKAWNHQLVVWFTCFGLAVIDRRTVLPMWEYVCCCGFAVRIVFSKVRFAGCFWRNYCPAPPLRPGSSSSVISKSSRPGSPVRSRRLLLVGVVLHRDVWLGVLKPNPSCFFFFFLWVSYYSLSWVWKLKCFSLLVFLCLRSTSNLVSVSNTSAQEGGNKTRNPPLHALLTIGNCLNHFHKTS